MNDLEKAIELIEKQQPKKRDAVWMVGEQLKGAVAKIIEGWTE